MPPETFLFDLDGTLVDSMHDLTTAVNLLRAELHLTPLEVPTVRTYVGDGAAALVQRALPDGLYGEERLQRFLALYGEHLLEQTAVYPGIREFLEMHREKRMAVVTNKPCRLTVELLQGLRLTPYFRTVIGGDSCAAKKPHPAPVFKALEELEAESAGAVLFGDHHTDLRAGRAAGVKTCFCAWGLGHDGGTPFDFRAGSPFELPALFPGAGR